MKKRTLHQRAYASGYSNPSAWLAGRAAGVRDQRKRTAALLKDADARLKDAERRVYNAEKTATEHQMRLEATVKEANRRAAMYESRLPATNGGYG